MTDPQKQLDSLSDFSLLTTWDALEEYDPSDVIYGIPMNDWAHMVKSEMERRGLPKKKYIKVEYRGCKYIGVLLMNQMNTVIKTVSNTIVPGLKSYRYRVTDDSDFDRWLDNIRRNNPEHEITIIENHV